MSGHRNHSEDTSGTQEIKFWKDGLNWLWGPPSVSGRRIPNTGPAKKMYTHFNERKLYVV
jgi:hypothetical protein